MPGNWIFLPGQSSLEHEGGLEPRSQQETSPCLSPRPVLCLAEEQICIISCHCISLQQMNPSSTVYLHGDGGEERVYSGNQEAWIWFCCSQERHQGWISQGLRMQEMEPDDPIQILASHLPPGDLRLGTYHSDTFAVMVPPSLGHYEE